jgi:serine/arginine repetitive matrix protein 1
VWFQVDLKKVQLEVLKPWIAQRITELLGIEDEVVVSLAVNYLESKVAWSPPF